MAREERISIRPGDIPPPIAAFSATLDRDDPYPKPADFVPPLWHWLYFLPIHRQSEFGPDGHPRRGGFIPPVPLPRRMFAGGRVQLLSSAACRERRSGVSRGSSSDSQRIGRNGPLVFVTGASTKSGIAMDSRWLRSTISSIARRFRPARPCSPPKPRRGCAWTREIFPRCQFAFPVLGTYVQSSPHSLRSRYCTEVEGYPGWWCMDL